MIYVINTYENKFEVYSLQEIEKEGVCEFLKRIIDYEGTDDTGARDVFVVISEEKLENILCDVFEGKASWTDLFGRLHNRADFVSGGFSREYTWPAILVGVVLEKKIKESLLKR